MTPTPLSLSYFFSVLLLLFISFLFSFLQCFPLSPLLYLSPSAPLSVFPSTFFTTDFEIGDQ
ncbi:MAG: hypothetical protein MJE68_21040 [Proteobacteria bacterium]|nr:hypothetical protein [Pseudomonadota bacterium]